MAAVLFVVGLKSAQCQTLIYGVENEIKDYNIVRSLDRNAFALSELVSEALFRQVPAGGMVPDLALHSERQGKVWKITLRETVFSDGQKLACEDVKQNLDESRNSGRPFSFRLKDISEVVCSGRVLQIKTFAPAPQLLNKIGYFFRVYKASTLKDRNPVGSGPFKIVDKEGKDIILRPNPFYKGEINYKEIRFRTLRDPWLRDLALFSGNVDFLMENFSRTRLKSYLAKPHIKLFRNPSTQLYFLALNSNKFNLEERRRIRSSLYGAKVVESFWEDNVEIARSLFGKNSFSEELPASEKWLDLEITCDAEETQLQFLRMLAQKLKADHIRIKVRPAEFATFMKKINAQNYAAYIGGIDVSHLQNLEALFRSDKGRLGLHDPALDEVFRKGSSADTDTLYEATKLQLENTNFKNAYLIPLYRPLKALVVGPRLTIKHSEQGFWRDILQGYK